MSESKPKYERYAYRIVGEDFEDVVDEAHGMDVRSDGTLVITSARDGNWLAIYAVGKWTVCERMFYESDA